jgi:hypothetical protein
MDKKGIDVNAFHILRMFAKNAEIVSRPDYCRTGFFFFDKKVISNRNVKREITDLPATCLSYFCTCPKKRKCHDKT